MGKKTEISWAHHTWQIWWGCEHASAEPDAAPGDISEECRSCYAESFDNRLGGDHWGHGREPRWFGDAYWAKLRTWNADAERAGERRRVFVSSMADWAQIHPDPVVNLKMDTARARFWGEVAACPWLNFLMLTKRAENLATMLPWMTGSPNHLNMQTGRPYSEPWPNVWPGVTCGTRRSLWRVHRLREVSAVVRFVSCEPLLDHITAEEWDRVLRRERAVVWDDGDVGGMPLPSNPVHWLIVGDESHQDPRKRRPAQPDWVRTAREAAARHGVAFHLKQLHIDGRKIHLPVFDGRQHKAFPE